MRSLTATPGLVIVDTAAASRGTSRIHYATDEAGGAQIWERFDLSGSWERRDLDSALESGAYTVQLRPGDAYQAALYLGIDLVNPNDAGDIIPPRKLVTVLAIKKAGKKTLIEDEGAEVGGTYFFRLAATSVDTLAYTQISRSPPETDGTGITTAVDMVEGSGSIFSSGPVSSLSGPHKRIHRLTMLPLLAGNTYHALTSLIDRDGNWQFIAEKFTTKKRHISISFLEIFIDNDGDPAGRSTAEFRFSVSEGLREVKTFHVGDENYSITDGQVIKLMPPWDYVAQSGYHVITRNTERVYVNVEGKDFDGWLESDETARGGTSIDFPFGMDEEVASRTISIRTYPMAGDDFEFSVKISYGVSYQ